MLAGLYVLLVLAVGVTGQAMFPEEFCDKPPPVYRGKEFEIVVNQTVYQYNQFVEVTVRPTATGRFRHIADFFLYAPGTKEHPGNNGSNFVGEWYAMSPSAPAFCGSRSYAAGVKSSYPSWRFHKFTVTWKAPVPRTFVYNNQLYSYPGDTERSRPHIYFAVYATPDPPVKIWAPGAQHHHQRKWYFAHSVKVENWEIKANRERQKAEEKKYKEWANMWESMN